VCRPVRVAVRLSGAIALAGRTIFCGFGFLAADVLGIPNVWHFLHAAVGVAAVTAAIWLVFPAIKRVTTGRADAYWTHDWRPVRLAAFLSHFRVVALMTGDFAWLGFLGFLLFLLPIPATPRTPS
jgi:hypothetical protein